MGETLSSPFVGIPGEGFTQSFISFGAFDTEFQAQSLLKYIKTKFARTLLSIAKTTQDNNADTWRFVPMQDFTQGSDNDWSLSVDEIDEVLWEKYHLNDKEKDFIKTMVKRMH